MKVILTLLLAIAVIAAVIAFVAWILPDRGGEPIEPIENEEVARQVYRSEAYGFDFDVPEGLVYREYTPEAISVGASTSDGFAAVADMRIYSSETGTDTDLSEFTTMTIKNACAADGANATVYCDSVASRESFLSAEGISGELLYFVRKYENFETGEVIQDRFGPVYTYELPNDSKNTFMILTITPPANLPEDQILTDSIEKIAESMSFEMADS